jgi:hypothetical protein
MIDVERVFGPPEKRHLRLDGAGLFLAGFPEYIVGPLHVEPPEGWFDGAALDSFPISRLDFNWQLNPHQSGAQCERK